MADKNQYSRKSLLDVYRFSGDKDRIKYSVLKNRNIEVLPDFSSSFGNFVWYSSAQEVLASSVNRITDDYPWDGSWYDHYHYVFSSSLFEEYYTNIFPKYMGYGHFYQDTAMFASGSDNSGHIEPGSGSYALEIWLKLGASEDTGYDIIFSRGIEEYSMYLMREKSFGPGGFTSQLVFAAKSASTFVSIATEADINEWVYVGVDINKTADVISLYTGSTNTTPLLVSSSSYGIGNMFLGNSMYYFCSGGWMTWWDTVDSSSSGFYTGNIDECRFWNKSIGYDQVKSYYNTDIKAQESLMGYWKFNEPGDYSEKVLRNIVDYSGHKSHAWLNISSSLFRESGSALWNEDGTLLQYKDHTRVVAFTGSWALRAESFDTYNDNMITKQLPSKFIETDEDNDKVLTRFLYAYAKQLDEVKLYIIQSMNLQNIAYSQYDRVPNQLLTEVAKNMGINISDPFGGAAIRQRLFGHDVISSGSIGNSLMEVRNEILLRTINTLPYMFKTKGRPDVLRTILNIYGIDSSVVKLREYGYNLTEGIKEAREGDRERTPYLGLFDPGP